MKSLGTITALTIGLGLSWSLATADEPVQLTLGSGVDRHPTWSADGQTIVFESYRNGMWQLYSIPVGGGTEAQLTSGALDSMDPEISPDGSKIAFLRGYVYSDGSIENSGIWVMPFGGGTLTEVLPDTGEVAQHPTWSADGSTIYIQCRVNGVWKICRVPATGGAVEMVIDDEYTIRPALSPDSGHLGFGKFVGGVYNVYETTLPTPGEFVQRTFESRNTSPEDYSPDGTRLLVSSRRIQNRLELFELDRATGEMARLTFDAEIHGYDPQNQLAAYSPDGTRIAYSSKRITGETNVWLLDLAEPPVPPTTTLHVGSGAGLPGGGAVEVEVGLLSPEAVPALEFVLTDVPDWVTVAAVHPAGRAAGMTVSFVDEGSVHVLVYGPAGEVIPPGTGTILELEVLPSPGATLNETAALNLGGVVVSDQAGSPIQVAVLDGSFHFQRVAGDVNGDNLVDVGDLVRLVEIILGTGDPPSAEEGLAADCNTDGSLNALDVTCLLDFILNGQGGEPGVLPLADGGALLEYMVESDAEVRGLQIKLPAGTATAGVTGDLGPLVAYSGVDPAGSPLVLLFDANGGTWPAESTRVLRMAAAPVGFRAYGRGGRALTSSMEAGKLHIGTPAIGQLALLPSLPNPFHGATTIRFVAAQSGVVTLSVINVRGALVQARRLEIRRAGEHELQWAAEDRHGRELPPGVYFLTLEAEGRHVATRLVHLGR